jgi:hypothetical protein
MTPIDPEAIEAALANAPAPKVKRCEVCNAVLRRDNDTGRCAPHQTVRGKGERLIVRDYHPGGRADAKRDKHGRYTVDHPEMTAREYVKMKLTET